ncbi:hypothetical protein [Azospirillum argentinense]
MIAYNAMKLRRLRETARQLNAATIDCRLRRDHAMEALHAARSAMASYTNYQGPPVEGVERDPRTGEAVRVRRLRPAVPNHVAQALRDREADYQALAHEHSDLSTRWAEAAGLVENLERYLKDQGVDLGSR